ncbi:MAG: hypothetical protein ABFR05_05075 [Bacteroidota bacterium]
MRTRILILLFTSFMFVLGQQSLAQSLVLNQDEKNHFFLKVSENDNRYEVLYYRIGEKGKEVLLFDPNEYKDEKGNAFLIKCFSSNDQGSKVCLALGTNESKRTSLYIIDVKTKQLHEEKIDNCLNRKVTWTKDGKSFMYCQKYFDVNEAGELVGELFFHKVGTNPSDDKLVSFSDNFPEYY